MKRIVLLLALCCGLWAVAAEKNAAADAWTIFGLSFTPAVPSDMALFDVYGVKVGAPMSGGAKSVYGVEAAVLYAGTENVAGIQCSLITANSQKLTGLQLSLVNFGVKVQGLQLGIVNMAEERAFQIGLVNYVRDGAFPWLPIVNWNL